VAAVFSQLPGALDLVFIKSDEVNVALNLQRNITGYTLTSAIFDATPNAIAGGFGSQAAFGATVVQPTIGVVNASTGELILGLSEAQTGTLSTTGSYRWYLRWVAPGDITRTIVSGSVTASAP
jgi:hypothetical protein